MSGPIKNECKTSNSHMPENEQLNLRLAGEDLIHGVADAGIGNMALSAGAMVSSASFRREFITSDVFLLRAPFYLCALLGVYSWSSIAMAYVASECEVSSGRSVGSLSWDKRSSMLLSNQGGRNALPKLHTELSKSDSGLLSGEAYALVTLSCGREAIFLPPWPLVDQLRVDRAGLTIAEKQPWQGLASVDRNGSSDPYCRGWRCCEERMIV
eukprot:767996-Hanusia_phi.AAC.3